MMNACVSSSSSSCPFSHQLCLSCLFLACHFSFYIVLKCNVASLGFLIMCFVRGFASLSTSPREYNAEMDEGELQSSVFTAVNVGYLILSSTLGIIIGDVLWLEALSILGAKHVIIIDSIKPFGAAILGRVVLDEVLMPPAWGGMILTVVGIGVVGWEEQRSPISSSADATIPTQEVKGVNASASAVDITADQMEDSILRIEYNNEHEQDGVAREEQKSSATIGTHSTEYQTVGDCSDIKQINYKRGYACAVVNVLADSLGSLLTKQYGVGMTTWSINLIRFGFAGAVLVGISISMRMKQQISRSSKNDNVNAMNINKVDNISVLHKHESGCPLPRWFELPTLTRRGWVKISTGVGLVTFLCPALSNYSLFQITLGLAVSLGSVGPLYGLILDWPFKGRRPTVYGCIGAFFAVAGVAVLSLTS